MAIWNERGAAIHSGPRFLPALIGLLFLQNGCLVKHTVRVPVSPSIREAKTATGPELLQMLAQFQRDVRALSSGSMKITFTSGKPESGKLQQYRSAPGYILLARPDFLRMNIQNPITKTTLAEMVSVGDEFSVWYPRENKLFRGKNSVRDYQLEDGTSLQLRPRHILDALLPASLQPEEPSQRLALEEQQDSAAKYYVLTLLRDGSNGIMIPLRRQWIDRSIMACARSASYVEAGMLESAMTYAGHRQVGPLLFPTQIRLERPQEGYSIDLVFRDWRLNPELPDQAFALPVPAGARLVELREKSKGGAR